MTKAITSPSSADQATVPEPPSSWAPVGSTIALLTALGILMAGQMYAVLAMLFPMATAFGATTGEATWTATAFGMMPGTALEAILARGGWCRCRVLKSLRTRLRW